MTSSPKPCDETRQDTSHQYGHKHSPFVKGTSDRDTNTTTSPEVSWTSRPFLCALRPNKTLSSSVTSFGGLHLYPKGVSADPFSHPQWRPPEEDPDVLSVLVSGETPKVRPDPKGPPDPKTREVLTDRVLERVDVVLLRPWEPARPTTDQEFGNRRTGSSSARRHGPPRPSESSRPGPDRIGEARTVTGPAPRKQVIISLLACITSYRCPASEDGILKSVEQKW